MNHDHQDATCPYCVTTKNQIPHQSKLGAGLRFAPQKAFGEKLRAFLGVCGCFSCYIAMFPAILLGIVGIFGLSSAQTLDVLNAYMGSVLFQPILIISILLLVVGLLRYGKMPLVLSILAGIGIFASMNFYMRSWLFTFSFVLLALAYLLAYRKSKSVQLKTALILISAVVILGVIDIGRTAFSSPHPQNNNVPQQQMPLPMMQINITTVDGTYAIPGRRKIGTRDGLYLDTPYYSLFHRNNPPMRKVEERWSRGDKYK